MNGTPNYYYSCTLISFIKTLNLQDNNVRSEVSKSEKEKDEDTDEGLC